MKRFETCSLWASVKELDFTFLNHRWSAKKSRYPQRYGIRMVKGGKMVSHGRPYPESC